MRLFLRTAWMRSAACLTTALAVSNAVAVNSAAPSRPLSGVPMAAVWREQHVDFVYLGRTARYSCEGLRDKVRAMLLDLGARRDLSMTANGCADPSRLKITFSVPALADSALKPLHAGDLAATDARFEAFTITSDTFRNMGIGDCELVAEFTRQILPKFVTRELRRDITCVPYQHSGSRFLVKGEILRPLPLLEQGPARQSVTAQ